MIQLSELQPDDRFIVDVNDTTGQSNRKTCLCILMLMLSIKISINLFVCIITYAHTHVCICTYVHLHSCMYISDMIFEHYQLSH